MPTTCSGACEAWVPLSDNPDSNSEAQFTVEVPGPTVTDFSYYTTATIPTVTVTQVSTHVQVYTTTKVQIRAETRTRYITMANGDQQQAHSSITLPLHLNAMPTSFNIAGDSVTLSVSGQPDCVDRARFTSTALGLAGTLCSLSLFLVLAGAFHSSNGWGGLPRNWRSWRAAIIASACTFGITGAVLSGMGTPNSGLCINTHTVGVAGSFFTAVAIVMAAYASRPAKKPLLEGERLERQARKAVEKAMEGREEGKIEVAH